MSTQGDTFFTAVGCMDGRVQDPVAWFGKRKFSVKYPDSITEAGLVGLLAKGFIDPQFEQNMRFKIVEVSIGMHHSEGIIVHGHQECAGNPVEDEHHIEDIRKAVRRIQGWLSADNQIPVVGVFVKRNLNTWVAEEI